MKALGFGEVLWDIIQDQEYIGGAPMNALAHMSKLGAQTELITGVGKDRRGDMALHILKNFHIGTKFARTIEGHPTGIALATLDEKGSATYDLPLSAYDYITVSAEMIREMNEFQPDLFYMGTLAQRNEVSAKTLHEILKKVQSKHVFFDVNIRMGFYPVEILEPCLNATTILKINDEEAVLLSDRLYGVVYPTEEFVVKIASDYQLEIVLVTMGKQGCLVYDGKTFTTVPGNKVTVIDTIGAGDSFSAAFLWALFEGNSPARAAECGNLMGGFVASCAGAVPEYTPEHLEKIMAYKKS